MLALKPRGTLEISSAPEGYVDVFASLMPWRGGFMSVHRRFQKKFFWSQTTLVCATFDAMFRPCGDQREICRGEDPRIFQYREKPWAMSFLYDGRRKDWNLFLVDLESGQCRPVRDRNRRFYGKSWVPVVHGETLYLITSLDPLNVVACNVEDGSCAPVIDRPYTCKIGQFRCGGSALAIDGKLVGLGHRTHSRSHHTVFWYELDLDRGTTTIVPPRDINGRGLVDPTSLFRWQDCLMTCCCLSSGYWHGRQRPDIRHVLYEVAVDADPARRLTLGGREPSDAFWAWFRRLWK